MHESTLTLSHAAEALSVLLFVDTTDSEESTVCYSYD